MKKRKVFISLLLLAICFSRLIYNVIADPNCDPVITYGLGNNGESHGESSTTAGAVPSDTFGILGFGTIVNIGDTKWQGTDYELPMIYKDKKFIPNNNYGTQGDTHWDWYSVDENGKTTIDVSNPEAKEFLKQMADRYKVDLPDDWSKADSTISEIIKNLAKDGGSSDLNKGYQATVTIRNPDGSHTTYTAAEIADHPELLNDYWVGSSLKEFLKVACPPSGQCEFTDEGSYCNGDPDCGDPQDDDDDEKQDDDKLKDDDKDDDNDDDTIIEEFSVCISNCNAEWNFDFSPKTCDLSIPRITTKQSNIPECPKSTPRATCENPNETTYSCSTSTIACGYATTQTVVTTKIQFPGNPTNNQILYAGHPFVWSKLSSSQNVTTKIVDTSAYENEIASINAQISGYQGYINCLKGGIEAFKAMISQIRADISPHNKCWKEIADYQLVLYSCGTTEEPGKMCSKTEQVGTHWEEDGPCMAAAQNTISQIEAAIRGNEAGIASANITLGNLSAKLATVQKCGAEISSYTGYNYTTPDVVKIISSEMQLGSYKQDANSIVAIEKNSGKGLKENEKVNGRYVEMPGGLSTDTKHSSNFYIPVDVKNLVTGTVSLTINDAETYFAGDSYSTSASYPDTSNIDATMKYTTYTSASTDLSYYDEWKNIIESTNGQRTEWINAFCNNYRDSFFSKMKLKEMNETSEYRGYIRSSGKKYSTDGDSCNRSNSICDYFDYRYYVNNRDYVNNRNIGYYTENSNSSSEIYNRFYYQCRDSWFREENRQNSDDSSEYTINSYSKYQCYAAVDKFLSTSSTDCGAKRTAQKTYNFSVDFNNTSSVDYLIFYRLFSSEIKNIGMKLRKSATTSDIAASSGVEEYQLTNTKEPLGNQLAGQQMNKSGKFTESTSRTYTCDIKVFNPYICDSAESCEGSLNLIYRQISLENPFPNTNNDGSTYRKMGLNWNPMLADFYVKNNRGVSGNNVYDLEPLYTITLTPNLITDIRNDFSGISLTDFNLTCDKDGKNCVSDFIHGYLVNKGAINN